MTSNCAGVASRLKGRSRTGSLPCQCHAMASYSMNQSTCDHWTLLPHDVDPAVLPIQRGFSQCSRRAWEVEHLMGTSTFMKARSGRIGLTWCAHSTGSRHKIGQVC
eukprot:6348709-Amphidinium_carterae.1